MKIYFKGSRERTVADGVDDAVWVSVQNCKEICKCNVVGKDIRNV